MRAVFLDRRSGVLVFTLCDKNEMSDLTPKQRETLKERIKDELKTRRKT